MHNEGIQIQDIYPSMMGRDVKEKFSGIEENLVRYKSCRVEGPNSVPVTSKYQLGNTDA
jgi:hypothetical protein